MIENERNVVQMIIVITLQVQHERINNEICIDIGIMRIFSSFFVYFTSFYIYFYSLFLQIESKVFFKFNMMLDD